MKNKAFYLRELGFLPTEDPSLSEIKEKYRSLCLLYHPDCGGDSDMFIRITEAKDWLVKNWGTEIVNIINPLSDDILDLLIKEIRKNPTKQQTQKKKYENLEFVPTTDQECALDALWEFLKSPNNVFLLKGKAGVGKSSVISQITKDYYLNGKSVCVSAFTNKATSVVSKKNPFATKMTLFRLLELKANEESDQLSFDVKFKKDKYREDPVELFDLILCDEISMVNDQHYKMLKEKVLRYNKKLIVIGDKYQLKPISQNTDCIAFEEPLDYELTEIVRQSSNSDIPIYADQVRKIIDRINMGEKIDIKTKLDRTSLKGAGDIQFFDNSKPFLDLLLADFTSQEYKQNSDYVKVLAYRNNTIDKMNEIIRRNIFSDVKEVLLEGEQILLESYGFRYDDQSISCYDPSQELIIRKIVDKKIYDETHHGVKLTFPYIVADVESKDDKRQERINLIYPNQKENFDMLIKKWAKEIGKQWDKKKIFREEFYPFKKRFNLPIYGYAITVHKSQGSTMDRIFLIEDDIEQVKLASQKELWAAKYTSMTRASKKLVILNRIK